MWMQCAIVFKWLLLVRFFGEKFTDWASKYDITSNRVKVSAETRSLWKSALILAETNYFIFYVSFSAISLIFIISLRKNQWMQILFFLPDLLKQVATQSQIYRHKLHSAAEHLFCLALKIQHNFYISDFPHSNHYFSISKSNRKSRKT
jgi:hypothetical protein